MAKPIRVHVRRVLSLLLVVYLLILALLASFQRSLIYQPRRCDRLIAHPPKKIRDVTVTAYDGLKLYGWIALAKSSVSLEAVDLKNALSNEYPVVLYFPGNAGNRSMRSTQMQVMSRLNAHLILVDYRGYGDNPGKPTEESLARDARSAWNFLTEDLGVGRQRIVIYGESLGGGVATRLASELCREGIEPGGLIVQSTFNSLVAVAQYHFPVIPVSMLLVDRFLSEMRIPHVTCPILQIHGEQDLIVPLPYGQRLFDAARSSSSSGIGKRQLILPNTDHNDVYSDAFQLESSLVAELKRLFETVMGATNPNDS